MTPSQISLALNSINAEVTIFRIQNSYADFNERWGCSLSLEQSGTSIKVRATAGDLETALSAAYNKLLPLISTPAIASALALPSPE